LDKIQIESKMKNGHTWLITHVYGIRSPESVEQWSRCSLFRPIESRGEVGSGGKKSAGGPAAFGRESTDSADKSAGA
jgi:hypothetical protein